MSIGGGQGMYFLKQLTSSYLATHWSILDLWHYRHHWHYWHHWHHWSYSHWLTALISSAAHLLTDNLIFLNPKTIFSLKQRFSNVTGAQNQFIRYNFSNKTISLNLLKATII
ncbi:hypothetical protein BpHYR1_004255 [Brachionus plicatilis]|uniref:Uncharacterized protein n=1 Tax=Brachionus plicatilis TaxID=10195 RepID=A0A3M7RTD4_BRAPC|nr:hypothetical protein BpHYR1_004255 [Brachionus plicatilis]